MPKIVVMGGLLQCNKGAAPTPIKCTTMPLIMADKPVATEMDFAPIVNITPFGVCQTLTQSASGVPTPCVPALTGWKKGSEVVAIGNFAALTEDSEAQCSIGGKVTVQDPGQTVTEVE